MRFRGSISGGEEAVNKQVRSLNKHPFGGYVDNKRCRNQENNNIRLLEYDDEVSKEIKRENTQIREEKIGNRFTPFNKMNLMTNCGIKCSQ